MTFNWKIRQQGVIRRKWQQVDYPILSVPSGRKTPRPRRVYPLRLSKARVQKNFATVVLTNGVGGVGQFPARPGALHSKYDGLLCITPDWLNPADRLVLVKMIRETVQVGNKFFDLDDSFLHCFIRYPQPLWKFIYDDGEYFIKLERSLVMPPGENSIYVRYKLQEANAPITLICKCYLECRSCHHQLRADEHLQSHYENSCRPLMDRPGVQFIPQEGINVRVAARRGEYISQPHWLNNLTFPLDEQRGQEDRGDAFSPGLFHLKLSQGDSQVLVFTADQESLERLSYYRAASMENKHIKKLLRLPTAPRARNDPLVKMLVAALDQFIIHTDRGGQVLAGLPWLGVRIRDALQMVGGLLAAGRSDIARDIILNCGPTEQEGLLRDWLSGYSKNRTNAEASLRLFLAAHDYVNRLGDETFWDRPFPDQRCLRRVLVSIYQHFRDHRAGGISLDHNTGMLYLPTGFTWMNSDNPRSTPRAGYPVEIQALWYRALEVLAKVDPPSAREAHQWRRMIQQKFIPLFWDEKRGCLADVLTAEYNITAEKATPDPCLRFNQLAALQAQLVPLEQARQILDLVTRKLLIPAGIRSLAEDPLASPLKIVDNQGKLLTDPRLPYQGRCRGDETARRLAYHNGSAWPWAYPGFIEARAAVFNFSELAVKQALAFFEPVWAELASGGIGTLPEIKDGNYPHTPRGCYAYALSVAETLRVYMMLKYRQSPTPSFAPKSALVKTVSG
ncbi:MAG: hypothetical protein AMJ79_12700 [Phycisphaerae bacterium SM23_30]|nr:MAG: hypothetical protein AMJ79_12700 [Phycisphaerae bacterium SM23_30]